MKLLLHSVAHATGDFWAVIGDAALDCLKDVAISLPILFVAYLLMELLENSKKLNEDVLRRYSKKAGPAIGGVLGMIPQCGIAGAAATLFSTGAISVGTMLAVFFATSDEMLPLMLSNLGKNIDLTSLLLIVLGKGLLGICLGYLCDLILKRFIRSEKDIHSFCQREHCACDEKHSNVFLSALKHTLKIGIVLIIVNFVLNTVFGLIGKDQLTGTFLNWPVVGELVLALFGLIPNCFVSVVITQSYLNGLIGLGCLFSGLLANAGIGLLVLVRTNKNAKENVAIITTLYVLSVICGIAITLISGIF